MGVDAILAAFASGWLLGLLTSVCLAGSAAAQPLEAAAGEPEVLTAELVAIVTPPRAAVEMAISYRLKTGGSTEIPLAILALGASRATELTVDCQGKRLELRPSSSSNPRRQMLEIVLPQALAAQQELELELRYIVDRGLFGEMDGPLAASLPVAAVLWPPATEAAEAFRAEVRLPDGWSLYDPFPSGLRRLVSDLEADLSVRLPVQTWQASLPVVPSMLRFRARRGAAPWLSPDRVADLSSVALLLALLLFGGWRLSKGPSR